MQRERTKGVLLRCPVMLSSVLLGAWLHPRFACEFMVRRSDSAETKAEAVVKFPRGLLSETLRSVDGRE